MEIMELKAIIRELTTEIQQQNRLGRRKDQQLKDMSLEIIQIKENEKLKKA